MLRFGVIRWDAWVGELNPVGLEVEKTLQNPQYSNRLPFYSNFVDGKITIRCITQEIVDKEIKYASDSLIDYFAFCWYPFQSGLNTARDLFLQSNLKKINYCIILGTNSFSYDDALWLIERFSDSNYEKINNQPLVYIFNPTSEIEKIIQFIRENSKIYKPYFVGLVWNEQMAYKATKDLNCNAISQYCTPGKNGIEYHKLANKEREKWEQYSCINEVIPWVTTGWDKRPRFFNPVSWEDCSSFNQEYISFPNLEQLKFQLKSAIDFQQKKKGENKHVLIYAWNEFDEGGFIAPTLNINGIDCSKLMAIKDVIIQYRK